jgi:hypothetical protein
MHHIARTQTYCRVSTTQVRTPDTARSSAAGTCRCRTPSSGARTAQSRRAVARLCMLSVLMCACVYAIAYRCDTAVRRATRTVTCISVAIVNHANASTHTCQNRCCRPPTHAPYTYTQSHSHCAHGETTPTHTRARAHAAPARDPPHRTRGSRRASATRSSTCTATARRQSQCCNRGSVSAHGTRS